MKRLLQGFFAIAILAVVFSLGPQVTQASASCRTAQPTEYGYYEPGGDSTWYSITYVVPSSSTCHDINIRNFHRQDNGGYSWAYFRVHMFIGGGDFYTSWTYVDTNNTNNTDKVLASNVADGTAYRLEWKWNNAPGAPYWDFTLKD